MSGSLVFITGSTGFIGSQVVVATLKAGYRVRLSIRKADQEATLRKQHAKFNGQIETCVVSDMTQQESFKNVLDGVDYIFHLASPMPGNGTDVRHDYVDPAVQMTESILYAAMEFPRIKNVVIVSSLLALAPVDALISTDVSVTENTGEIIPVDLSMTFPDGFVGHAMKYSASKIFAHQATRSFKEKNHPHYTLLTLHPTFVLGDSLVQKTAQDLSGMNGLFFASLVSEKPKIGNAWVHVRDVADAHVKALQNKIESGTEIILSGPTVSWEAVAAFVRNKYPALGCKLEAPFEGGWKVDNGTAERVLGLKWRSEERIIEDVLDQQLLLRANGSI